MNQLTAQERKMIRHIQMETVRKNVDNISRTEAYFTFFKTNPEITWSFLASMVSRNGGWNMCDLESEVYRQLLATDTRKLLFLTFERANWLIFHDAFPQLLLYQFSKKIKKPMFHLLPFLNVSSFIQKEWARYWQGKNQTRLLTALIINEQNVIQTPVMEHPIYKHKVFRSLLFSFQDWLHFSSVLFPTCGGELYGASVYGFRSLSKRINLGKRLAGILFEPRLFPAFFEFAEKTPHTGSRYDYEHYLKTASFKKRESPFLRMTYPVVAHRHAQYEDWSLTRWVSPLWFQFPVHHKHPTLLTDWYYAKKEQLQLLLLVKRRFHVKHRI